MKSRIRAFSILFLLALSACDPANQGRDMSGTTIQYSEWNQMNPLELHGNLATVFSGMTLRDAKWRTRSSGARQEQVAVQGVGIITTEQLQSGGRWDIRTREIHTNRSAFQRYVETNYPTALKVEFTRILPATNPNYMVYGFVADVVITRAEGATLRCAWAKIGFGDRRIPRATMQVSEIGTVLTAIFCGANQTATNLERRLQAVAFGQLPMPFQTSVSVTAPAPVVTERQPPPATETARTAVTAQSEITRTESGILSQTRIRQGAVRNGSLALPLPDGDWREIGRDRSSGSGGDRISVLLALWRAGKVEALVNIESSVTAQQNPDLEVPRECARSDVYFNDAPRRERNNFECFSVNHITFSPNRELSNRWGQLYRRIEPNPGMPRTFVAARQIMAVDGIYLNYIFYVNPEIYGFASDARNWNENGWNISRATNEQRVFFEQVKIWAEPLRRSVVAAMRT